MLNQTKKSNRRFHKNVNMHFQRVNKQVKLIVLYLYLKSNFLLANIIKSTCVTQNMSMCWSFMLHLLLLLKTFPILVLKPKFVEIAALFNMNVFRLNTQSYCWFIRTYFKQPP